MTLLEGETQDLVKGLIGVVQELLEMLGVVFILDALILELSLRGRSLLLRFR